MKAYYCPVLFEHNDGHDEPGFIYHDEDESLLRLTPGHETNIPGSVKLDGQDLVEIIRLGLPILSPEQVDEIAAALKPIQDAFKEAA